MLQNEVSLQMSTVAPREQGATGTVPTIRERNEHVLMIIGSMPQLAH